MDGIGRDKLQLRDLPIPTPQKGEVLVKGAEVALNYRDKMVIESGRELPLGKRTYTSLPTKSCGSSASSVYSH